MPNFEYLLVLSAAGGLTGCAVQLGLNNDPGSCTTPRDATAPSFRALTAAHALTDPASPAERRASVPAVADLVANIDKGGSAAQMDPVNADDVNLALDKHPANFHIDVIGADAQSIRAFTMTLMPWRDEYVAVGSLSKSQLDAGSQAVAQVGDLLKRQQVAYPYALDATRQQKAVQTLDSVGRSDAAMADTIKQVLDRGGFEVMALSGAGEMIREYSVQPQFRDATKIQGSFQKLYTGAVLATYFRAYFRGGHLIQVSLDTADLSKQLNNKVGDALQKLQPSGDVQNSIRSALDGAINDLCRSGASSTTPCLLSPPLGQDAFVTRAGMSVQFSGISVELAKGGKPSASLSYPKPDEFGPQLIRVLFEGVYDSIGILVPAAANSTACKEKLYTGSLCLTDADT